MVRQKQMEKVVMAEFSEKVLDDIWLTEDVFGEQDRDYSNLETPNWGGILLMWLTGV